MSRFFRSLVAVVLVISLFASPSRAFDPLSFTAFVGYSLLVHCGAGAGLYFWAKNGSASVSTVGTISKDAKVQWIDAKDIQVKSNDLRVSMSGAVVRNAVINTPSKYPNIKTALSSLNPVYAPQPSQASYVVGTAPVSSDFVGKTVKWQENGYSGYARITGVSGNITYGSGSTSYRGPGLYYYGSSLVYSFADKFDSGRGWCVAVTVSGVPSPSDAVVVAPVSDLRAKIAPSGYVVNTLYQDELDKMFKDEDYVPVFTDSAGLPYASPPSSSVMTPSQVDAYNKNGLAREAAAQAASSAAQSATNAGNAYTASGGDLTTGTGGDPALYQKYLDSKAAADKAAADAAEGEAEDTDSSSYTGSFDNSTPYGDQTKDFNFGTRFQSFFDAMKNTALFSLPKQFLGSIPGSASSSISFNGGRFGQFTYDFAQFDGLFVTIKSILLVLFAWLSAKIVMLKGGS